MKVKENGHLKIHSHMRG